MITVLLSSRRAFAAVLVAVAVATAGLSAAPVRADPGDDISDEQADSVRQNCKQIKSALQRLQDTDAATRVSRGRNYENLLNRLIAPLNGRVSANRYDASALVLATSTISDRFTAFKDDYYAYRNSFTVLQSTNCETNPRGFYTVLSQTRDARARVAADISALTAAITTYTDAFDSFRRSF